MKSIGTIKNKILGKLTESYANGEKTQIKEIINLIRDDKNFIDVYLFYEEIEKKYFDDKETAKLYVEEIIPILKEKISHMPASFFKQIEKKVGNIDVINNPLYESLDQLLEQDNLLNIDKKLIAKKTLIEQLTTKKEIPNDEETTLVENEKLYYSILANNFNVLYENTLSDEQKEQLKSVLSISQDDLNNVVSTLKEEILFKVSNLLTEHTDATLAQKLEETRNEVTRMTPTKYNLYKLQELKNGL